MPIFKIYAPLASFTTAIASGDLLPRSGYPMEEYLFGMPDVRGEEAIFPIREKSSGYFSP